MNTKKYLIGLVVVILLVMAVAIFLIYKKTPISPSPSQNNNGQNQANQLSIPKDTFAERQNSLSGAFAQKFNRPSDQVAITIAKENGQYVRGIVIISDLYTGVFLAKRNGEAWEIIWDGQKKYNCADLKNLDFPIELANCQ
jgi:hypothetical protein